ncbi:UDP-glycosyltransferase 86a1 [Phtheirospermum japonicum]|uniref:UDP-glycosyltransferase 86a1 n=1 Tax=Phtheirospermum japonicum TaxID=374723 RepID=A0A830CR66_9LAMI|nr:UDP-glycosyltransferase 86a1 [Phtheirospermum japonicum]
MVVCDFEARVDEFVAEMIRSDPYSVYFLVTDTVYTWPENIANKYGLVNVWFWTQPALVFSLAYHWDLLTQRGHFPAKGTHTHAYTCTYLLVLNLKHFMTI